MANRGRLAVLLLVTALVLTRSRAPVAEESLFANMQTYWPTVSGWLPEAPKPIIAG